MTGRRLLSGPAWGAMTAIARSAWSGGLSRRGRLDLRQINPFD